MHQRCNVRTVQILRRYANVSANDLELPSVDVEDNAVSFQFVDRWDAVEDNKVRSSTSDSGFLHIQLLSHYEQGADGKRNLAWHHCRVEYILGTRVLLTPDVVHGKVESESAVPVASTRHAIREILGKSQLVQDGTIAVSVAENKKVGCFV
eukprot:555982-Amphidinium_carterae.3